MAEARTAVASSSSMRRGRARDAKIWYHGCSFRNPNDGCTVTVPRYTLQSPSMYTSYSSAAAACEIEGG
ncbi:hypothetical protein BRADI_4g17912v3 [Brachypodium distachyon]|uniref:Uncharacterized protein n=1 Tax=Brachypodium distachyon TaxID=15368 RepID=A0A2K2CNJ7_BRADI|nr:hypothetical protein BRADI_4g17912v3 [Brachypodium distachyon]